MTAQDLKNSILQLAIQGKLVEQREEEGTAKELLEQIKVEKKKLIKEKKIKKQKPLPQIVEDEIPFEIPESWEWVRLGNLVSHRTGVSYKKENLSILSDDMVRVLRGGNIDELSYMIKDDDVMIDKSFVKKELILEKNTLITPAVTSLKHIGKMARIDKDYSDLAVGGFVLMLKPYFSTVDIMSKYLLYALSSQYHRKICRSITKKSGQAFYNISRDKLMAILVPIPPLEEQIKIIAKIEELMPFIEQYDKSHTKLEALNKRFPEDMQKSILQYAIQGKLVEQREEEGTSEELYQQIQEEKARLIKEEKMKKQKPLLEITDDEIPFEIPESWKWVRLRDLIVFCGGYAYKSTSYVQTSKNQVVRLGNVKNDKIVLDTNPVYISDETAVNTDNYRILPDDILFTMTGTRGKKDYFYTTVVGEEVLKERVLYLNQRVGCLRNAFGINVQWLSFFLKAQGVTTQVFANETGTANQGNIGSNNTMAILIPLPPLDEQKRIIAKAKKLLSCCEGLDSKLLL